MRRADLQGDRSRTAGRRIAFLEAASLLALVACQGPATPLDEWSQAPAEPGPVELVGHLTTATHAGDRGVVTHPASGSDEPPARCISYLDDIAREADSCTVSAEPFQPEHGEVVYPWTIQATWAGLRAWDERTVDRLAIHAFGDDGRPIAFWAGAMDEDAGHLTE